MLACVVPGSSAVEQPAVNRLVAGSNPARGANIFNHLRHRKPRPSCYEVPNRYHARDIEDPLSFRNYWSEIVSSLFFSDWSSLYMSQRAILRSRAPHGTGF